MTTNTATNIATQDERILDENYEAVYVLNRAQIESHLCSSDQARKALTNMRVYKDDQGYIVTESTNGSRLIQIKEKANDDIQHYPLDVNPAETNKVILGDRDEAQFIPGEVLDEIVRGFPRRKNFMAQPWQRNVVVSVNDDKLEVGRSDKQGKPVVDKFDKSQWTAFPPVEQVWPQGKPDASNTYLIENLKAVIEALEKAGATVVEFNLWGDKTKPLQFISVDKYGHKTERQVEGLVMPFAMEHK